MTLDNSIQGFCYHLPDLSAWPSWASGSQGPGFLSASTVPVQGLAQNQCPMCVERSPSVTVTVSQTNGGKAVPWGHRNKPDSVLILKVLPVWPGKDWQVHLELQWTVCCRNDRGQTQALWDTEEGESNWGHAASL